MSCSSQLELSSNLNSFNPVEQGIDTTSPEGIIILNNGNETASIANVTVFLKASDFFGITGYLLSEKSNDPSPQDSRWVNVSHQKDFQLTVSFKLSPEIGIKTLYVWFRDQAANISKVTNDSIVLLENGDSIPPTLQITSPTLLSQYSTTHTFIDVGGTASDNIGVSEVTWVNDRGGQGKASGTNQWNISQISLQPGLNVITVTASDAYTNSATDIINILSNSNIPAVTIEPATLITEESATLHATINPQGTTATTYFQYGLSSTQLNIETTHRILTGSEPIAFSENLVGLNLGTVYYYRIVSFNSSGTSRSNIRSFTSLSKVDQQFICTQVMGFSQTSGWYKNGFEQVSGIDESRWQFLGHTGAGIEKWLNINFSAWTDNFPDAFGEYNYHDSNNNRWYSECTSEAERPDRIIFTISSVPNINNIRADFPNYNGIYPKETPEDWVPEMKEIIQILKNKYSSVKQIVLQPLVGGPNHNTCIYGGVTVRATLLHPVVDLAITQTINELKKQGINDVSAGFSPEVRACNDYSDDKGHLTSSGYSAVAQSIANYYLNY